MCGIAGIVQLPRGGSTGSDARRESPRLVRMLDALRHRGPDGQGEAYPPYAALGTNRLALVDPAGGHQPIVSPDKRFTLVYNGELYNAPQLRRELRAWEFRTRCDTEVLLAAWITWGEACLDRLDGMFAFFVWDAERMRGFAARDRLGVKPFVYHRATDELLFASEAKALIPLLPSTPRLCTEAVLEMLVAPCFSGVEWTAVEGLEVLPPGGWLRVDAGGVTTGRWWEPRFERPPFGPPGDEGDVASLATELRQRLTSATAATLVADAPVGLFLSGGLDSTLLAGLARRAGAAPPGFTVRFEGQATVDYARSLIVTSDDSPHAERACGDLGLEHVWVDVSRSTLAEDLRRLAIQNCALPAWEQELAQHHLARAASSRVKAVLVGDAADETHYGYHFLLDAEATRSPAAILRRFADAPIRRDLLPDPISHFDAHYRQLCIDAGHGWDTPEQRLAATTHLILARWLPRLLHNGDIHTMAWGLEARVPFATREVVDFAARVSPTLGLCEGVEKWLLRSAAGGVVSPAIQWRKKSALPKDQGTSHVYRKELGALLDSMSPFFATYLDLDALGRRLERSDPSEMDRALFFRLITLGHWAQHYGVT